MYCTKCGTEIKPNSRFCHACGNMNAQPGTQYQNQSQNQTHSTRNQSQGQPAMQPQAYQPYPEQAAANQSQGQPVMQPQAYQPYPEQAAANQSQGQPAMQPQAYQPYSEQAAVNQYNSAHQFQNRQMDGYSFGHGFSQRINHPTFEKYKKNSNNWSFLFSFILAGIAAIAFPVYGKASGEIPWPQSLYYGLGIGGMFIVIAIIQVIKRGTDSTWDGIVADKKQYKRIHRNMDDSGIHRHYTEYVLKVRRDNGKLYKHKSIDQPGVYDYYNVGDKVRHHKGFYYYEKFDKSRDTQIICVACLTMNNIQDDLCFRCKCPLLK